jgi:hypothetical protein
MAPNGKGKKQEFAENGAKPAKEDEIRKKAIDKYDNRLSELERERFKLLESGSEDFDRFNKIDAEIEKLQLRKNTLENGGWTLDQAKITREPFTVNPGSRAQIELKQADIYTMPDGTKFVFKSGMNKAHQSLTPDVLISKYYEVPEVLRAEAQKTVAVVDRYNPEDKYWRQVYKNFPQSYATGGKMITFYRYDYEHDLDYLGQAMRHEIGHGVDRTHGENGNWFSGLQEWQNAMEKDKELSGAKSVTEYGENSPKEDFADSIMKYFGSSLEFESAFPNRASAIERLFGL